MATTNNFIGSTESLETESTNNITQNELGIMKKGPTEFSGLDNNKMDNGKKNNINDAKNWNNEK